jgi:hypothetical protein
MHINFGKKSSIKTNNFQQLNSSFKTQHQRALQLDFWPADEYERVICDVATCKHRECNQRFCNASHMGWSNFWMIICNKNTV